MIKNNEIFVKIFNDRKSNPNGEALEIVVRQLEVAMFPPEYTFMEQD
jgi:hypothetical protein